MSAEKPVCIVTGASSGVGFATAMEFAKNGYRVAICARNRQRLDEAANKVADACGTDDILCERIDVANAGQVQNFVQTVAHTCNRVDVLVNNAGSAILAPITDYPTTEFEEAISVHVRAVFVATKEVWPIMQGHAGGCIVNISSMAAVDPFAGFSVYGACKSWVELFTKATADEGAPLGIRAYALRLGAVETPLLRSLFPNFPQENVLPASLVAQRILALARAETSDESGSAIPMARDPSAV